MSARLLEHYDPPGMLEDGWRPEERLVATWVRAHGASDALSTAVAWLARAESMGDSCLALAEPQRCGSPGWPTSAVAALRTEPLVGDGASVVPLVIDDHNRLYWWRNWRHEQVISETLGRRIGTRGSNPAANNASDSNAQAIVDMLFADSDGAHDAAQREAVRRAGEALLILTGGPGTGKTRTALRLLLASQLTSEQPLRIALAAPTGKAAQRLNEALQQGATALRETSAAPPDSAVYSALQALLTEPARTVHRLLGYSPTSRRFRYGRGRPLDVDVVLVDEASMLDLDTLRALCDALPSRAALVLMGDAEQLGSVSTGSVFDDIVQTLEDGEGSPVVRLSYGFRSDAALTPALDATRWGDADRLIEQCSDRSATLHDVPDRHALAHRIHDWARSTVQRIAPLAHGRGEEAARELLSAWHGRQVLCALREGDFGAERIAVRLDAALAETLGVPADRRDFAGRSVLIRHNDYGRALFNGDLGVLLPDHNGRLRAWFPPSGGETAMRAFAPEDLPGHTSAAALTVHKSQGSEYGHVALVLPPSPHLELLDRRLVYTALTRARDSFELWCDEAVLRAALARRSGRVGGLRDKLMAQLVISAMRRTAPPKDPVE